MPINRFDTSVQPDYVSNRIALPFNEIHAMAAQHQKDYDTTEENAYKLKDLMANVKSINDPTLGLSNIQAKQQLDKTYSPEIEALSSDIAKGTNVHEASRKLEQLKRKWISDPNRIELEKSYADYTNYVEDKTKKGGKYGDYNDPYKNTALISDKGELKPFRYSGMADIEDYQGRAKDMMAGHLADSLGYKNVQLGSDGILRTNFGKDEAVSIDKIKQSSQYKAPDFLTTKEGKDWERMTKHQNPNVTQEQLQVAAGDYLFNAGMNQIHRGKETGNAIDVTHIEDRIYQEKKQAQQEAYETTFSQMGQQGVANLSEVAKAEPTNSILSKVINFINPNNQAKGLLNVLKVITPALGNLPQIKKIEDELTKNSNLNEDVINNHIEKITYEMKQQIGKDQKTFREKNGFENPIYNQTYTILDMFGKGKDTETNPDYERAKAVVAHSDPSFSKLTKQQQFNKVKGEMDKFVETSKTNITLVPMDKKELDFKNAQLTNLAGTPTEKTQQLMNLGLTANGKFIDFYTGKETTLADVAGGTEGMKYMGRLDNDNQFGPGMNYFQTADGKFYVSPGSLNTQKENYFNWNLKQVNNKFSQEHEFPLNFDNRRNINQDGSIPKGVPKGSISRDLKTGKIKGTIQLSDNDKINLIGNNEDEIKILFAKNLFDRGYSKEQVKQLGL